MNDNHINLMYFEETITFAEGTKKNLVGTAYFSIGILGTCLNLATLSILPECHKSLGRSLLIFFSIQLFVNISLMLCAAIPVPYMIAIDKPYFLNPILQSAIGVLLCLTMLISFCIQFFVCIYRNIDVVSPKFSALFFPDKIVYFLNIVAAVLAINKVVEICNKTTVRQFDIRSLSWIQTNAEFLSILTMISYASMAALMFYAFAIFDLLYRHIYDEEKSELLTRTKPLTKLLFQVIHLICDIVFCGFLSLPSFGSSEYALIFQSIINIYGTALWPTASLIIYSQKVREALSFRIRLMMKTCCSSPTEAVRTRNDARIRIM